MSEATCRLFRACETYAGKQGFDYAGGISAESAGAKGICMVLLTIKPGDRAKAHKHDGHETVIYVISGTSVMWYGERLEKRMVVGEGDMLWASHLMLAFGTYVAGAYGGLHAPRMAGGINEWQRRAATEMIEAHLDGRITIEEVAAVCGLSASRFAHAFRSSFGVAPYQWLQARRIDRAKSMLSGSAGALSDIAFACGFADQSHFGRVFRRAIGVTPGAFRRMLRGS